jgi:hypothetical protein
VNRDAFICTKDVQFISVFALFCLLVLRRKPLAGWFQVIAITTYSVPNVSVTLHGQPPQPYGYHIFAF